MTLLEEWRSKAYGEGTDNKQKTELWKDYFSVEKGIYEKLLSMSEPKDGDTEGTGGGIRHRHSDHDGIP